MQMIKILDYDRFIGEKLGIKPITKSRLSDMTPKVTFAERKKILNKAADKINKMFGEIEDLKYLAIEAEPLEASYKKTDYINGNGSFCYIYDNDDKDFIGDADDISYITYTDIGDSGMAYIYVIVMAYFGTYELVPYEDRMTKWPLDYYKNGQFERDVFDNILKNGSKYIDRKAFTYNNSVDVIGFGETTSIAIPFIIDNINVENNVDDKRFDDFVNEIKRTIINSDKYIKKGIEAVTKANW